MRNDIQIDKSVLTLNEPKRLLAASISRSASTEQLWRQSNSPRAFDEATYSGPAELLETRPRIMQSQPVFPAFGLPRSLSCLAFLRTMLSGDGSDSIH